MKLNWHEKTQFPKRYFLNWFSFGRTLHTTNYCDWLWKVENFNNNVNFLNVSQEGSQSHFLIKQSNPWYRFGISRHEFLPRPLPSTYKPRIESSIREFGFYGSEFMIRVYFTWLLSTIYTIKIAPFIIDEVGWER